jgi:RHS repeat-associated protein
LSSVVAITDATGTLTSQQRYLPFGQVRTNVVTPNSQSAMTDLSYTGQRDLGMGLMDYHARFYSPVLGRFTQPDTLIPNAENPQAWNRYSYVMNSPILYNDPTGHMEINDDDGAGCKTRKECGLDDDGGDNSDSESEDDMLSDMLNRVPSGQEACAFFLSGAQDMCNSENWESLYGYFNDLQWDSLKLEFADVLYALGAKSQDLATGLSYAGASVESTLIGIQCVAGPEGCGAGVLESWALWDLSPLNGIDAGLGLTSAGSTILADYWDDGSLGEASSTSFATAIAGAGNWDPIVDFAIDGYASGYNNGSFCGVITFIDGDCAP